LHMLVSSLPDFFSIRAEMVNALPTAWSCRVSSYCHAVRCSALSDGFLSGSS
jgi:hypothetical protein